MKKSLNGRFRAAEKNEATQRRSASGSSTAHRPGSLVWVVARTAQASDRKSQDAFVAPLTMTETNTHSSFWYQSKVGFILFIFLKGRVGVRVRHDDEDWSFSL